MATLGDLNRAWETALASVRTITRRADDDENNTTATLETQEDAEDTIATARLEEENNLIANNYYQGITASNEIGSLRYEPFTTSTSDGACSTISTSSDDFSWSINTDSISSYSSRPFAYSSFSFPQRMYCLSKVRHTLGANDDLICKRIEKDVKMDFANKLIMLINEEYYALPCEDNFKNILETRFVKVLRQPNNTNKLAEIKIEKDDIIPFVILMQEEMLDKNKKKLSLKQIQNLFGENNFPYLIITIYKSNDGKDYYFSYI